MAEKDIAEKILEAHNDVFADIVNVLLFDGKDVIEPDELFDKSGNGAYKADGRVSKFKSHFRVVADYFVQMRTSRNYKPSPQTIKHVNETLQLLSVLTKDNRFEEAYNETEKGEPTNMCEVLDRVETRGKNEGKTDILELMQKLFAQNRFEDAKRATGDSAYCDELLKEFGIDG